MISEKVLKILTQIGLPKTDAEVYLFLATKTPQKAKTIASQLGMHTQQVYRSLKKLHNKRMVNTIPGRITYFSAVPLERVLDLLIEAKREEAQQIQLHKEKILSTFQTSIMSEIVT